MGKTMESTRGAYPGIGASVSYANSGRDTVAESFARGERLQFGKVKAAMFTDGQTVWSYGYHYPIAEHLPDGRVGVNECRASRTTSQHTGAVKRALTARGLTPGEETYSELPDGKGYRFRIWG
jgi:hypothetical protein